MASMTRRQLFRGSFKAGQRVAGTSAGTQQAEQESATRIPDELRAIAGDFPPEMLSMEADRLGLDPDSSDRETLLKAIYEAMAGGGPRESGR